LLIIVGVSVAGSGCTRLGDAAKESAKSPRTWMPLVGAGLMYFDDMDDKISKWAYRENPLFNSKDNADDFSDFGQSVTWAAAQGTLLLVDQSWQNRGEEWVTMLVSREITSTVTRKIKRISGRERPLAPDSDESFPSGHTSKTATAAVFGRANLQRTKYAKWAPVFDVTAGLTGWARVEAGKHHPSDVFVGWAIGNFVGETATRAFFHDPYFRINVNLTPEQNYFGFTKGF
jgi:hypothetical protein